MITETKPSRRSGLSLSLHLFFGHMYKYFLFYVQVLALISLTHLYDAQFIHWDGATN